MQGAVPGAVVEYGMSPWMMALIALDVAVAVFAVAMIATMIKRSKTEKAHLECYAA